MFCNQCEQTIGGKGCAAKAGACGKNEDIQSLQDTLVYGLKGIAAYAYHARELGEKDETVDAFMHEALFKTLTNVSFDLNDHLEIVLRAGQVNLKAMELLDRGNTRHFGNPIPTEVYTGTKAGPGILVTGHDLLVLKKLLEQTEGTGINIYTHNEMLPAHGYPELKKHKHLAGNFGGPWWKQKEEFRNFSGPILVNTNCVQIPPANSYLERLFTTGISAVPGAAHIKGFDFSAVIKKAKELPALQDAPGKPLMTGFHHTAILGLAGKIVELVKAGKIKHFFLVGGCDGANNGRDYYTNFVKQTPKDTIILTLACGKYRFNSLDLGNIEGIPRLLDVGQCNDAYSAIQVALGLAKAFNCGVNDLPLSLVLSWYEQKAVAILLTLLSLNIKGIRLGFTPPAFLSPNVLKVLHETYDLKLISTPEIDLADILKKK